MYDSEMNELKKKVDKMLLPKSKEYQLGYQQGRSDKYQEIVSEYMLLTEKQVEDIRADERADERAKIKDEFKIYNRLEAKFTLNQCSEKDGLYCLDVTDLFYGLVDRVLGETNK